MWRHIPTVFGGRPALPAELPQRPAPDTLAGPDGSVIITVGAHPRVAVPDIRGRDEDDALSVLREAGLGADRRAARRSDRVPRVTSSERGRGPGPRWLPALASRTWSPPARETWPTVAAGATGEAGAWRGCRMARSCDRAEGLDRSGR